MKKKIIYSAVLTALLSASSIALAGGPEIMPEPDYFSGFYLGGIGGVHHNTFQGDSQVILGEDFVLPTAALPLGDGFSLLEAGIVNDNNLSGGEFDGYGGIQGGFGKVFAHQFYAGVQGWGEWGSTSLTETQTFPVLLSSFGVVLPDEGTVIVDPSATASTTTTMKISNDYGVAAKIGWVVAPRSMFYGKIGASWASVEVTNSLDVDSTANVFDEDGVVLLDTVAGDLSTGTSSHSDTKIGLLLGVGFEQFVYQDVVSINVEYTYVNYGHVSTTTDELTGTSLVTDVATATTLTNLVNDTDVVSRASTSVQVSSLMAGLNFYFGRDWI